MSNKKQILKTNLQASPLLLLLVWILLLIVPIFLLFFGGEALIEQNERLLVERTKLKILQEFQTFKNDLNSCGYLDRLISKENLLFEENISAKTLHEMFFKHTNIRILAVMRYDAKLDMAESFMEPQYTNTIGHIPSVVAKDLLKHQGNLKNIKHGLEALQTAGFIRANNYIKNILRMPADISLQPYKATPFISGHADIGRILCVYIPQKETKDQIYSGHLIIVRENEFSPKVLLEDAIQKSNNPDIKRGYHVTNDLKRFLRKCDSSEYKFIETEGGIELLGLPSEEIIIRLATNGSFYPLAINKFDEKFILLRISASREVLLHPLQIFLKNSKIYVLVFFCIVSTILLHRLIFGYISNLLILSKVFINITIASILPFSILASSLIFHHQYEQDLKIIEMENFSQLQTNNVTKMLNSFLDNHASKMANLGEITRMLSQAEKINYFKEHIKQLLLQSVFIKNDENENIIVYNKGNANEVLVYNENNKIIDEEGKALGIQPKFKATDLDNNLKGVERDSQKLLHIIFKNALKKTDIREKFNIANWQLNIQISPLVYTSFAENTGKATYIEGNKLNRLYSYTSILDSKASDPYYIYPNTMIIGSLITNDLLDGFISSNRSFTESITFNKYQIDYCFIPLEQKNELPNIAKFKKSANFDMDLVYEMANNIAYNFSNQTQYLNNKLVTAVVLPRINSIIISITSPITKSDISNSNTFIIILFVFSLTIFTILYFSKGFLIAPIRKLERGAEEIIKGNFHYKIEHNSGDEFETLAVAFNEMALNLLQKEKMSKYIATDILNEISNEKEKSLVPGGERINACILFCSIAGFKAFKEQNTAEKTIETLSQLIDLLDNITQKHSGHIDKLIEDTIMLVFRQNSNDFEHINLACKTALEISDTVKNRQMLKIEIGVASGEVISGKIGSKNGKLDFTVIGNPVNLAARLKSIASQATETGILICPQTIRLSKGLVKVKFIKREQIKGRTRSFPLYELLSIRKKE